MIASNPKYLDPQGKLFSVFNVSNFYSNNDLVTESRLMEYSNMYSKNIFYYMNSFLNGLTFEVSINGITKEIFSLISYLPNIIFELTNISYDELNNSTNIIGNSWFENSSVNMNLNVGSNLNVTNILTQKINSDVIEVNSLNCKNLKLNNRVFTEVVAYFYINSVSLPLKKSTLLSEFNITSIYTMHFTIMSNYRLDCIDINNNILFSFVNTTDNYIYYKLIPYNINIYKINLYDSMNILI
jgi:hypothetical protein